ncbi:MAG: hypothetical protein NTY38_31885 [Acidobacteria bacterium]|nr:hypothetical protein [Acidobacteriota bacterium]
MVALTAAAGLPQREVEPIAPTSPPDVRLPSGKMQREEILKAEYKKAVEESGTLLKMAEDLKIELEKNSSSVLSIPVLKKTEEIEKLARKIRSRLRQH